MLILGIQHVFAMFGATVLVPLITGLSVSTTLLMAGLGTLLFHFITGRKVFREKRDAIGKNKSNCRYIIPHHSFPFPATSRTACPRNCWTSTSPPSSGTRR